MLRDFAGAGGASIHACGPFLVAKPFDERFADL
jgi:hypothetical protein